MVVVARALAEVIDDRYGHSFPGVTNIAEVGTVVGFAWPDGVTGGSRRRLRERRNSSRPTHRTAE